MAGGRERGGRNPLEHALAVRDQLRARAAAEATAEVAQAEAWAADDRALETARQTLETLRAELSALQARVDTAARELEAAQARFEGRQLEEEALRLQHERDRLEAERQRVLDGEAAARAAERREIDEIDRRLIERARSLRDREGAVVHSDGRAKPRFDVPASIIFEHGEAVVLCPLVDLSLTGALCSMGGAKLEGLELGSQHRVTLVVDDDAKLQVELVGRVVRCVADTFALDWSQHAEAQAGVARLLDSLSAPREPSEEEQRRREIDEIDERLDRLVGSAASERPGLARAKPRVIVTASMLLDHDGRIEELVLLNVSRTGGLIASAGSVIARTRVGALVLMTLVTSQDPTHKVDLLARVVRHEAHTTAVDWSEDRAAEHGIARFIAALVDRGEEA
jgi:hypothetical protein